MCIRACVPNRLMPLPGANPGDTPPLLNISLQYVKCPDPMPDSASLFPSGFGVDLPAAGTSSLLLFALAAGVVAVVALLSERPGNDDDDSTPGGGLMQPVA